MKAAPFLLCFCFAFATTAAEPSIYHDGWNDLNKNGSKDAYEDPAQPPARRAADLLARMSLEEKIGQLVQAHREADAEKKFGEAIRHGQMSSFLDGSVLIETPGPRNRLQRIAVEESRLGIPLIFGHDSIHGFRTLFPIPLAQSCAWEPELFERTQAISARETAAVGIDWTFAPMADLARDPRWGRIAEGFGEDPWLGARDAAACVNGFQGTNVAARDRVVACLKHYVGYGAAEGGRDYNTAEISEFTLRNFYLPQFKSGVDAGALTVMSAFNLLSGVPASASRHTLTDILRTEWKFPGFVISDWTSIEELIPHGVAADGAETARLAMNAGVDMEMVSTNYSSTLNRQVGIGVGAGGVAEVTVNEAARRILAVKLAKGLFEKPYVEETLYLDAFLRSDAVALAREAAAKSCVLLKNDGPALPLAKQTRKLALIGPLAEDAEELVGCWYARVHVNDVVSLAAGIRAKLPADGELIVARGCAIKETGKERRHVGDFSEIKEHLVSGPEEIDQAVAAAKSADVVVLALGEPRDWSGEDSSRSELTLPGRQMELFEAIVATGKPVIVVLFNGRPLVLTRLQEKATAILEAWHPGVQGGNAVADVLFGDAEPAGRLTTSFPRSVGQLPVYYNHFNTGRPLLGKYIDGPREPLYPFGFGLTYSTFEYGKAELGTNTLKVGQTLTARVKLKNTGTRAGSEVVQLYLRALSSSAGPRPVRELKGFQRVQLNPGESGDVEFQITDRELGCYDAKGRWLVEPGHYQLWLTKDAVSGDVAEFELEPGANGRTKPD